MLDPQSDQADGPVPGSRLRAFWFLVEKEPARLLAVAYFWFVAVGFAHLFGTGIAFGVNVIDLSSPTDFLIAGVRDPFVTLAAGLSGWWLYVIWRNSLTSRRAHCALIPTAFALLLACAVGSGGYRYLVTKGRLRDCWLAPELLDVTLGDANTPEALRIGVTTSSFIIFATEDSNSVIVKRDDVKRMQQRK